MLVSHDRQFVDNTVTECWIFEGGGRIGQYVGAITTPAVSRPSLWRKSRRSLKNDGSRSAKAETVKRGGNKLSYNLQRELEQLPQKLEALEAELQTLQDQVADPISSGNRTIARSRCWRSWPKRSRRWKRPLNAEYLEGLKNGA